MAFTATFRLNDKFRPRADAQLLSAMVQAAWAEYQASMFPAEERATVASTLAEYLTTRFPADDMDVLARYSLCETIESIRVRVYSKSEGKDYHDWSATTTIDLPYPVRVSSGSPDIFACSPRWSETAERGVTEEYRTEQIAAGTWDEFCRDQDKRDAELPPRSIDPYFAKIIEARNLYGAEYRQATEFPAKYKAATGNYPTWTDIADEFPVLGAYLRRVAGEVTENSCAA